MSIQNAVVKAGATGLTVVGGTDMSLTPDGLSVANGIHVSNAAETDFRIRENLTVKYKQPTFNGGVYSKDRKSMVYVEPKILTDGSTVFNLIRIEREVHPETTAAEALNLNMIGGQLLSDTDFTSFWAGGNLS